MRLYTSTITQRLLGAGLASVLLAAAGSAPASAGLFDRDRVFADSFGNLVVISPSGSKRIVVGQGHLAKELSEYTSAGTDTGGGGGPQVFYEQQDPDQPIYEQTYGGGYSNTRPCNAQGVLLRGRGYMYGLDGIVPVLERPCP